MDPQNRLSLEERDFTKELKDLELGLKTEKRSFNELVESLNEKTQGHGKLIDQILELVDEFDSHMVDTKKRQQSEIEGLRETIQQEQKDLDERKLKVDQVSTDADELVRLNIQGLQTRIVRRELLTKVPNSLLADSFSGEHKLKTIGQEQFIDRDVDAFSEMLNVLRSNGKYTPQLEPNKMKLFELETQFWGVDRQSILLHQFFCKDLIDLMNSEPKKLKGKGLIKWKELGIIKKDDLVNYRLTQEEQKLEFKEIEIHSGEYKGEVDEDGKAQGLGKWEKEDGSLIFEGFLQNDKWDGFGRFIWADGSCYVGQWKEGSANGTGKYVNSFGIVQEGEWKMDQFQG